MRPVPPPASRPIAIANYDFRASGTVAKSIEIATALAEHGLPVELWVNRDAGPLRRRVPAPLPVVEVRAQRWPCGGRGLDLALSVPALAATVRARRPTVLLSGGNHFHLAARLALRLAGRRAQTAFGGRASNSSWRPASGEPARLRPPGWADRLKYGDMQFVGAVSEALAVELRELRPDLPVQCIANGVDVERVQRLAREPLDHPFIGERRGPLLAAMGRLGHQKGFDLLIRALALLPAALDARLLIIGSGPAAEREALLALAGRLGVGERVALAGHLDNPFAALARADLFVSASRWEGASNALLEAMACGLRLVATDCPTGNREILGDGRWGRLVPVEDPDALAEAIRLGLADPPASAERAAAVERHALRHCLAGWVRLLGARHEAVLAERHRQPGGALA